MYTLPAFMLLNFLPLIFSKFFMSVTAGGDIFLSNKVSSVTLHFMLANNICLFCEQYTVNKQLLLNIEKNVNLSNKFFQI